MCSVFFPSYCGCRLVLYTATGGQCYQVADGTQNLALIHICFCKILRGWCRIKWFFCSTHVCFGPYAVHVLWWRIHWVFTQPWRWRVSICIFFFCKPYKILHKLILVLAIFLILVTFLGVYYCLCVPSNPSIYMQYIIYQWITFWTIVLDISLQDKHVYCWKMIKLCKINHFGHMVEM